MNQPVTDIQLHGKDEPELLAMIASVTQELASIKPCNGDHQLTSESLHAPIVLRETASHAVRSTLAGPIGLVA